MRLVIAPVLLMLMARLAERPAGGQVLGTGLGIVGVGLMLFTGIRPVDGRGVLASVAAMTRRPAAAS